MKTHSDPNNIASRIREAVDTPAGLSLKELADEIGETADITNSSVGVLYRRGHVFQAGVRKFFRYFKNEADALAFDLIAESLYIEHKKEMGRQKRLRIKQRAESGEPYIRPERRAKEPVAPKPPRPPRQRAELVLQRAQQATTAPAKPEKIIWPETVKVQVHPTPPSRFAFEPPPGWRGQITNDWMDRRLGAAS